jgi:hypothetical protein
MLDENGPLAKNIASYPKQWQTILLTLMKYGMFMADNGGNTSHCFITCDNNLGADGASGWQGIYLLDGTQTTSANYTDGSLASLAAGKGVFMNDMAHLMNIVDPSTGTPNFYVAAPTDGGLVTEQGGSTAPLATISLTGSDAYVVAGASGVYIEGADPVRLTSNGANVTLTKGQTLCAYSPGQNQGLLGGGDGVATSVTAS